MLELVARSLKTSGAAGREVVGIGPFQAFFAPDSDDYLMSFATAATGSEPTDWDGSIAELRAEFERRGRTLRLEFFEELHPTLGPALERAGIPHERRAAAMALARDELHPALKMTGGGYRSVTEDLLEDFLHAHNESFGMARERATVWLPGMRSGLANGTVLAGTTLISGEPASGAMMLVGGPAGELAGVWTAKAHRGHGLAGDVCTRLLNEFFEAGHEFSWLSTDEESGGLYTRLGFRPIGTQLNFGLGGA